MSSVNDIRKVTGVYIWTASKLGEYMECLNVTHDKYWVVWYVLRERGGAVFEALRYKPEGSGIDSRLQRNMCN
jgi:hypothetical protein